MKLERLRLMGLGEIADRTRSQACRWWDRLAAGDVPSGAGNGGTSARVEAFRADVPGRFFAGAADPRTAALLRLRAPQAVAETIAGADRSREGHFDLLGYRGLSFGHPVDWQLDPVSGRRAPLVHWSLLDPLDPAAAGDSKVVWELNRHQWMVEWGQAYALTGDEGYAEAFAGQAAAWLDANPAGRGLNWASSLEVALRLMAWSWALVLFRASPHLRPALFARMSGALGAHAAHVERYLSRYFSPNTHLTGEALGLFYAGSLFPEHRRARRWRARGARILLAEMGRQVRPDGVHFERSTCYHRYTVEIALHFLALAARGGFSVPAGLGPRVQAMLDFLLAVRSPRGEVPALGDADGGRLLPLARRPPGDLGALFGVAAALFGRADYAWAARGAVDELLWLLGPAGLEAFDALRPAPPEAPPSRLFADGGYAVMRDGWGPEANHLVFDVGPLGDPLSAGHGHAGLLAVQCAAFGEPCLVDAGTGTYAEPAWRRYFRGTAAHSTVMVDGASQAEPAGPFTWRQRPAASLRRWLSTGAFDFADAEHEAYGRLPDPVRHRRRVLFVKPRYWVMVDDLFGAARHRVELRFQLAPAEVGLEDGGWTRAVVAGRALLLRSFAGVPLQVRLAAGRSQPLEGWLSPDYGQWHPAPVVVLSAEAPLPLRILTLLLPVVDPAVPPPPVRPLFREGLGPVGLVFADGGERVMEDQDGRLVHTGQDAGVP